MHRLVVHGSTPLSTGAAARGSSRRDEVISAREKGTYRGIVCRILHLFRQIVEPMKEMHDVSHKANKSILLSFQILYRNFQLVFLAIFQRIPPIVVSNGALTLHSIGDYDDVRIRIVISISFNG